MTIVSSAPLTGSHEMDFRVYTVIADPCTGMLFESRQLWNDAGEAYRQHSQDFRPLQDATRAISTHDGYTVGDNVAWLTPGEWIESDGLVVSIRG